MDHTRDSQVDQLFDEIEECSDFDLLVNNVWGGYEGLTENGDFTWPEPFWKQPRWRWPAMLDVGVPSAFVASQRAVRAMLPRKNGLIVNISSWSAQKNIGNTIYGVAKAATDKMSADMAIELEGCGIDVISFYPGLVRTDRVMESADHLDLSNSESPRFSGRVIAALLKEKELTHSFSGKICVGAAMAQQLEIEDIDGARPKPLSLDTV